MQKQHSKKNLLECALGLTEFFSAPDQMNKKTVKGMGTKDTKSTTMKNGPDEEAKRDGKRAKGTDARHKKEARDTRDSEKGPAGGENYQKAECYGQGPRVAASAQSE